MPNLYRVYYKNSNAPSETWEYNVTAERRLDAKWQGIVAAKNDGHLHGWINVYCELVN